MVPRPPLRADSVAWQRVQASGTTNPAPELQEWVASIGSSSSSDSDSDDSSSTNAPFFADVKVGAASSSA
jgi:hypothetical protein